MLLRRTLRLASHFRVPTGHPAPAFKLPAVDVEGTFTDIELQKGRWHVLLFYPLDFTFVCPTEITAFSDAQPKFEALNTTVMAISIDSKYTHLAWRNTPRSHGGLGEISIPLVSDVGGKLASQFGILSDAGIAYRGLFLIDPKGMVKASIVHDTSVGRSVDETLRIVEAFQHAETTSEVCPANWTKGKAAMKPCVKEAKAYFAQAR